MLFALALFAAQPSPGERLVAPARELLGTPYDFGGRLGSRGLPEGIDCQGVLFFAAERAFPGCGWRSFSVMPTVAIPAGELGRAVPGLSPVATADLDLTALRAGDVLWFIGSAENPAEPAVTKLRGREHWVWHTGLYSGEGHFIVGDHYAGEVVETALLPYLREHADVYAGLVVTRLVDRPRPRRCRRGDRPMR